MLTELHFLLNHCAVELSPRSAAPARAALCLGKVKVTAEIVDHRRGPKIDILKYKNKIGYRRRQGHRSELTAVKVTDIKTAK